MKTILLILLTGISGFALRAQTPPASLSATNRDGSANEEALRRALEETLAEEARIVAAAGRTNQAATNGAATDAPATSVPPVPPVAQVPPPAIPSPSVAAPGPASPQTNDIAVVTAQPAKPDVPPAPPEEMLPAGTINFPATDINQVLTIYSELVARTILRPATLPAPLITLKTQTPLTKREAIQAFDSVLALNGIAMINIGEKFVKAVPVGQANMEGAAFSKLGVDELPDMGQYVTHIAQLKFAKPSELVQVLAPFAKIPNSILPIDSSQILVIRDYAENVKRILEMIEQVDVTVPLDYLSEVIPIKYALAGDIASALNSLSSGGSGTTVGGRSSTGRAGGATTPGYPGGVNQPGGIPGRTTPLGATGAPGGAQSTVPSFTDRLQSIIKRASTTGDFQILGQTKIIADERTNSLLIFAGQPDMDMIKKIVAQLDVVLAQVLIEAIIMEVSLDDTLNLGVSYLEQKAHGAGSYFNGIGAIKNHQSFLTPGSFGNALTNGASGLASGFSYLGRFGDDFDVTLTAIAGDNRVNVLSRPRIQTSHAVPAQLFIGNTVPYIQGTTFGDFAGVSSRSVYQEKRVGISLDVLPLINSEGLVVMDIQQVIQQLGTPVTIDGNPVPTITERTASAKVAVRDRETVILGGFISSTKSTSKSGVPFLKDIPLLGYLFRSTGTLNQRVELIVLMRPTVLPTPEAAAAVARTDRDNMPGVKLAEAEFQAQEDKRLKQANRELKTKQGTYDFQPVDRQ